MKNINAKWFYAALIRAVRTLAQTALGMFTVGAALNEIKWEYVISVSVVAGIYSLLTSLATGLPETKSDGVLQIDTNNEKDIYRLEMDDELETIKDKKTITLIVNKEADLSQ
jgi:hypothetical protein